VPGTGLDAVGCVLLVTFDIGPNGSIGAEVVGRGRTSSMTAADLLDHTGRRPVWMRDGLCREHPEVAV
jgi:hypothetical protein